MNSIPLGPPPGSGTTPEGPRPPLRSRASLYVPANLLVLAWFVAAGVVTLGHRFVPQSGWLMVHLMLLGGVSTAIILWSQHFAEVLLRRPAPGGRSMLWARLIGWSAGAAVLTAGMVLENTLVVVAGAVVLVAVVATHLVILIKQRTGNTKMLGNRYAHLVRYYLAACAFLPIGIAMGVMLARLETGPEVTGRLYVAHLVATMLGWIGLTVAGTLVLLWPTVLRTKISEAADAAGRHALAVLLGGVLVLLAAAATGLRIAVVVGAVIVAAGIARLGVHVWHQARAATPTTFAAFSVAASLAWFLYSVLAFGVLVVTAPNWTAVPERMTDLIAPFAVGFVAQIMIGSMSYLVPVVLGGGPGAARWSIASMDRWAYLRLVMLNLALIVFMLPAPSLVKVTVSMIGLVPLLAFLAITLRTILVQRLPEKRTLAGQAPRAGEPVSVIPTTTMATRAAGAGIGAGIVALAVVLGVSLDPTAAGLTNLPAVQAPVDAGGAAADTGETTTVTVTMADMRFSPNVIEVPAGNRLVIELANEDDQVHDLVLATGASSGRVSPGQSATVDVGVVSADIDGWCSVAGHRIMGMTLTVVAVGAGETVAAPADPPMDHSGMDHSGMNHDSEPSGESAAADLDLMANPGDGFEARNPVLAPAATSGTDAFGTVSEPDPDGIGTLHRITMTVGEVEREVAPGVTQKLWTFNGQSPGPTLRGAVGDTFVITLVNDGSMGHSIDFHAGALAPDEPMRTIDVGESLTYSFHAERSGIWMYHCSTMPMSLHIANGMFGAVVIDPPGLPEVDREYLLVQSEFYLGPQGEVADAARIATQNPDLVTFNGYANQYKHDQLEARVGERVRIWVLDVGPNRPSSFHIVGGQFDTVFFEGDWQLRDGGSTGTGGSQALALQAAQGGFVELVFPEAGHYPFVSHIMSDAEKGAGGVVAVQP